MNQRISLTATSHPDEDRMIVEIWLDGALAVELLEGRPEDTLLLYPHPGGGPWTVTTSLLEEAVRAASARMDALLGR